jgi:GNAT superfamily N-acetyltransferase
MAIVQAVTPAQMDQVRELISEYYDSTLHHERVDKDFVKKGLEFQRVQPELEELPGEYGPPDGRILLAFVEDDLAGCVALRKIRQGACEMKRLYLRPAFRGQGLGRALAEEIIAEAHAMGFATMYLDTGKFMRAAPALYRSLGFVHTEPFYDAPQFILEHIDFMVLDLATWPGKN